MTLKNWALPPNRSLISSATLKAKNALRAASSSCPTASRAGAPQPISRKPTSLWPSEASPTRAILRHRNPSVSASNRPLNLRLHSTTITLTAWRMCGLDVILNLSERFKTRRDAVANKLREVDMNAHYILSDYIDRAMAQAEYDKLDDGAFAGRIPACKGVVAFGATLKE